MTVTVERIRDGDWQTFRDVRLAALADAPDAFWATLQDESRNTAQDWIRFLEAAAWFVAQRDGKAVGLVGGLLRPEAPDEPEVIGMWVEPSDRGQGIAALLLKAVCDWAEGRNAVALVLWVAEGNIAARNVYERQGFRLTGERDRFPPPRAHIVEERLRREFGDIATNT